MAPKPKHPAGPAMTLGNMRGGSIFCVLSVVSWGGLDDEAAETRHRGRCTLHHWSFLVDLRFLDTRLVHTLNI